MLHLDCKFIVIKNVYEVEDSDIDEQIRLLPTYLKYGLNNMNACFAKIHGIHTRELSMFLSQKYNNPDSARFLSWLINLSDSEIESFDISVWDKENIRSVSEKICLKNNKEQPNLFSCKIKGTFFNSEFKEESLQINSASQLYLKREEDNQFDPYAIQVMHNEKPIGYIPKEDSKFISTEMDINHTEYEVKISFIAAKKDYNEIQVILSEKQESQ